MAPTSSSSKRNQSDDLLEAFRVQQRVKKIQTLYQRNTNKSKILKEKPSQERMDCLAFLHRSDIQTGKVLGVGSFAQVLEVKGINLTSCCDNNDKQALREQLHQKAQQGQLVLKELKPDVSDFCTAAVDLATEAAFLMRLSHENLVNLRAVPADFLQAFRPSRNGSSSFFLLLDRVDTTVEEELHVWSKSKRSAPSAAQRTQYARQLASVLGYLHEHGIVYRDLKPDNVGLSRSTHQIQLFDFGLARQLPSFSTSLLSSSSKRQYTDGSDDDDDDNSSSSSNNSNNSSSSEPLETTYKMSCAGTPRYIAPEVAIQERYNTKADVYSWAILVWEMMTLTRAFPGFSQRDLCQRVFVEQERPSLKSVAGGMSSILADAWQNDPIQRPTMENLVAQLSHIAEAKTSRPFGFLRRRSSLLSSAPHVAMCA